MTTERMIMYTGGTQHAMQFMEKYKKLGYLVDIYSDEWANAQDPDEYSGPTPDDLKKYDKEHGTAYRGHLLCLYIDVYNQELITDLRNLYKPFDDYCNIDTGSWRALNLPDMMLINLNTQEILCVGLGYKNNAFNFELGKFMEARNENSNASADKKCSEAFYALDFDRVAQKTIREMTQLGQNFYEYDNLSGNSDVAVTLNEDDGLYYFDDFDEEGMTEEEVNSLRNEYENYNEWIEDNISTLRNFYPKIQDYELNTGAY
jgi:hypothetical protein